MSADLDAYRRPYPCDGCGRPGSEETLWLNAPLGLTAVHVHRDRGCAEAARVSRGGGTFREREPERLVRRDEDGASLKAAGWCPVADVEARDWDRPGRRRTTQHEIVERVRWEAPR